MKSLLLLLGGWLAVLAVLPGTAPARDVVALSGMLKADEGAKTDSEKKAEIVPAPPPATLRWTNGESVRGEMIEATEKALTWKTPLFEDPLLLGWRALHRIDQAWPDSTPEGAFQFVLRDGSSLYGDLAGITADAVTIHSTRHGETILKRGELISAQRIKGKQLIYGGPLGESGWKAVPGINGNQNGEGSDYVTLGNVPAWVTGPGGTLVLPYPRRPVFLKLPLPERMETEFRVRSKERPAFSLALGGDGSEVLRVETWGDELVLTAGDQFQSLRTMTEKEREVVLRVCWDRKAHRCQVYSIEGNLLKEWTVPAVKTDKGAKVEGGVRLENKGRELVLEALRVQDWDGQPPPSGLDLKNTRVRFDDGRTVPGIVSALEGDEVRLDAIGEGPAARFPLAEVDALIFANSVPWTNLNETSLTYTDGTFLRGRVVGCQDGSVALKTTFTEAPLTAKLGALRQLFVRGVAQADGPPEPAFKSLDKLVAGDTTLHGRLVADGDAVPHWRPVGGERAATPSKTLAEEIVRMLDPATIKADKVSLFYTRWGDVLPGTLHGITRTALEMESPVADVKSLPTGEWEAVRFNVATGGSIQGFNAPGWQSAATKKDPLPTEDKVTLNEGVILAQPVAAQNGEIRFTYETTNFSTLRVRLFCDGSSPAKSLSYLIFRSGNEFTTGVETTEGEFNQQNSTYTQSGAATVRFAIDEKGVRCYLNNALADTIAFPEGKRPGTGLTLQATSMWGNSIQAVQLAKFSATVEPGQGSFQAVSLDAKAQALTVPRFRKEDPPRHALLAANGDILRGEIDAVTNTQFGFRVGLDILRVPRDRVTGMVALQKPVEGQVAKPSAADAVALLLDKPIEESGSYWNSNFSSLIQVAQRSAPALKIKLPDNANSLRGRYRFAAKSVGETIAALCEQFGLHYRVEGDTVVIEGGPPKLPPELSQKVYWLRTDAVAAKGPVQSTLAGSGITFGTGAGTEWQAGARQLTMINTAENQEKLARLLASDFGGVLGSPTHWLRLVNGGRIGLAVERFEPEVVVGIHPLYGRCRVPMAEVYGIRNTPPDAPAVNSQATSSWQLVYAPEPVLPESGGEGSAMLGKDAPEFKLAMLDGGDFELSKERGHVVVLDFWATWCGPCIKSLPGLIEAMGQFPAEKVKLVGLDQAEPPEQVKRFLNTRGWKLAVAMDAGQKVGQQYGVDGIPHTVIVGPDGKIAWIKTGYTEDGDELAAAAVKKLLGSTAPEAGAPTAGTTESAIEPKVAAKEGESAE